MAVDWNRVPVVAGAGQVTSRHEDPGVAPDPFALMQEAAATAAASAGGAGGPGEGLAGLTHVWMVHSLSVRHGDPAGELARRLGATRAEARCSGMGGSVPQWLVNRAADEVAAGGRPRILICGAEALATRRRAKKAGVTLEWPASKGWPETWPPLEADLGVHPAERAHGLDAATAMYALVETAIAHGDGEGPDAHRRAMGELMAGLNAVAAANPYSWFPARRSADELATVTADNRLIWYPYPKYMNAVMDVDMSAAVIVTDGATARQWGLGPGDVAYLRGWADAHEVWNLSQRVDVQRSPALEACATTALEAGRIGVDEVGAFDLYACFPSSVEVARDSFGLKRDDGRPLTLTGGLPYHGGPGSNYVTHAVANALTWLRAGSGDHAVVHGNGYYLTKHAVGLYSRRPPATEPVPVGGLQQRLDAAATVLPVEVDGKGRGTVVAYTVPFGRDGARGSGVVLVDLPGPGDGSGSKDGGVVRAVARADGALTDELLSTDAVGAAVTLVAGVDGASPVAHNA